MTGTQSGVLHVPARPRYATGVGESGHAIDTAAAAAALASPPGGKAPVTAAVCGTLTAVLVNVRFPGGAGRGASNTWQPYCRTDTCVSLNPCHECAWIVAVATGQADQEADRLTPGPRRAAVLARFLPDPLIAVTACRAIIAAAASGHGCELDHPATIQLLAAVTAHAPVVLVPEGCADGDCEHYPPGYDPCGGPPFECPYPQASVACAACSLCAGSWAGGYEGKFRSECTIPAPCAPLQQLSAYAVDALAQAQAQADATAWTAGEAQP